MSRGEFGVQRQFWASALTIHKVYKIETDAIRKPYLKQLKSLK